MELLLSALLIGGIILYGKIQECNVNSHCNTYQVDWGKVTEDRIMNNLSDTQVNKNIASGKYDTGKKF